MILNVVLALAVLPAPRQFVKTGGFVKDPVVTETRDASLPAADISATSPAV